MQHRIKKKFSHDSAALFPLSAQVYRHAINKTLPYPYAASVDSCGEVVRNLTYGRFRDAASGAEGALTDLVKNPLLDHDHDHPDQNNDPTVGTQRVEAMVRNADRQAGVDRHFQKEEVWKCVTLADLDYELGFVKAVPPGLRVEYDNDDKEWPDRASSERAVFDARSLDVDQDVQTAPREQSAAAEFLSVPEIDIYHFGGCGQRKIIDDESPSYCCSKVKRDEYNSEDFHKLERHVKARLNQNIECPANRGIYTYYHNLNVNRSTPLRRNDNAKNYVHTFSIVPIQYEGRKQLKEVLNHDDFRRQDLSELDIANLHVAQLEIGFAAIHGSLEISLDRDQQNRLCSTTQTFKKESPQFLRHEKRLVVDKEIKGPGLPSPTQLYEMGLYRLYNIDRGAWEEEPLPAVPGAALPDSHPGNHRMVI